MSSYLNKMLLFSVFVYFNIDVFAQSKFEQYFPPSDFSSLQSTGSIDITALRQKDKTYNPLSARKIQIATRDFNAKSKADGKSLIIRHYKDADQTVWLEVSPSKSITKNGSIIGKTYELFDEFKTLYNIGDPRKELRVKTQHQDDQGESHIRIQQYYKDIPIYQSELIVHTDLGQPYLITGNTYKIPPSINSQPKLTEAQAIQIALISQRRSTYPKTSYNT